MVAFINIQCPQCKTIHSVADSYLYQKVRCPKCDIEFAAHEMTSPASTDDWRKNKGMTPAEQLAAAHNDDTFALLIIILCAILMIVEIGAMIFFLTQLNPPLPDGPYAMALSQKLSIIESAKIKIAIDFIAILITLIPLPLACILNVLTKIYRLTH